MECLIFDFLLFGLYLNSFIFDLECLIFDLKSSLIDLGSFISLQSSIVEYSLPHREILPYKLVLLSNGTCLVKYVPHIFSGADVWNVISFKYFDSILNSIIFIQIQLIQIILLEFKPELIQIIKFYKHQSNINLTDE